MLSASGHIAGVVNPPGSKYGHWENDESPPTSEEWLATATAVRDSWWPVWERWDTQYAGGEVRRATPATASSNRSRTPPAPYVKVRAAD